MDIVTTIFTLLASSGLSLSAGVRAYLPVLALGIAADIPPIAGFQIHLRPEFAWVGSWWFIGIVALLTIYEISADKIPVIDHINDVVHTVIRPLAGALIFTATANPLSDSGMGGAWAAAIIGGSLAGATHATKAGVVRPASTVATAGLANPIVSLLEDALVIVTTFLALVFPIIAGIFVLIIVFFVGRGFLNRAKRRQQNAALAGAGQVRPPANGGGARR